MEKIRTTVRIAGKDYTMASYDKEEYMQRVASYVNRKMQEISLATNIPGGQLAVLTALNVCDDMLKAHDENTRLKRELGEAQQQLDMLKVEVEQMKRERAETE